MTDTRPLRIGNDPAGDGELAAMQENSREEPTITRRKARAFQRCYDRDFHLWKPQYLLENRYYSAVIILRCKTCGSEVEAIGDCNSPSEIEITEGLRGSE